MIMKLINFIDFFFFQQEVTSEISVQNLCRKRALVIVKNY